MANHAKKTIGARLALLKQSPLLITFCILLFGLFALNLATPDKEISEMENKELEQRPTINFETLTTSNAVKTFNKFFTNYSTYAKEQVVFRDSLISAYSFVETGIFQKTDIGRIYLGDEDMMFPKTLGFLASEPKYYQKNLAALASLGEAYPDKVSAIIAPTASVIYPENLPNDAPLLDINVLLDEVMQTGMAAGINMIDLRDTLGAHKDEYIYYRTDHHWTTLGAYYAYSAYCESLDMEPFDTTAHTAVTVEDFYGTHYAKARTWNAVPDTLTYYDLDNELSIYSIQGPKKLVLDKVTGMYDTEKFEAYDKYGAFMQGNIGYGQLAGDGEGKVLVLKDSYANCFLPYLTANFERIDIIDYRSYVYGLDSLIAEHEYDQILVLYNIDSFKNDGFFYRAGIRG